MLVVQLIFVQRHSSKLLDAAIAFNSVIGQSQVSDHTYSLLPSLSLPVPQFAGAASSRLRRRLGSDLLLLSTVEQSRLGASLQELVKSATPAVSSDQFLHMASFAGSSSEGPTSADGTQPLMLSGLWSCVLCWLALISFIIARDFTWIFRLDLNFMLVL